MRACPAGLSRLFPDFCPVNTGMGSSLKQLRLSEWTCSVFLDILQIIVRNSCLYLCYG